MQTEDTVIEQAFAEAYDTHALFECPLTPQVEFKTFCGTFRPDFITHLQSRTIAFECDGRDYHDHFRDEVRDAALLGDGFVSVIYRFPGDVLFYAPERAIKFVLEHDPVLFGERAAAVLDSQIAGNEFPGDFMFIRRSVDGKNPKRQHWKFIYHKMKELSLHTIDDYAVWLEAHPKIL